MTRYLILMAMMMLCLPVRGEAWQVVGGAVVNTVSLVGSTSYANGVTELNFTLPVPSGTTEGDLMVLSALIDASGQPEYIPEGWTLLHSPVGGGSGFTGRTFYRTAPASVPSTYVVSTGEYATSAKMATLTTWRKTGGTWSVTSNMTEQSSGATITPTQIAGATNGVLFSTYFQDGNADVSNPPSGMTNVFVVGSSSGGTLSTVLAGYYQQVQSGSNYGQPLTWSTSEETACVQVVLSAQ